MNRVLNILGKIALVFLVIVLIIYSYASIQINLMLKTNLEAFDYIFYKVEDDLGLDDIDVGDVLIINKDKEYETGDYIMYYTGRNNYNISSVTNTNSLETTLTSGENIKNTYITGLVAGRFKGLGKAIDFLTKTSTLVVTAIIGFTLVILSQTLGLKHSKE